MSNPLESLTLAASSEALPLELLQPLDSSNPASTPVRLSGPEQRLTVTPDPGVGDESLLPPSQLLIVKDGESRSIWPVHLAGWQALGWQLQTEPAEAAPESEPEPEPAPQPGPEPDAEPAPLGESSTAELTELPSPELVEPATAATDGEALLASEPPDFQAMTKAQIVDYCSAVHGVELDASQTKAELIEQATALEAQANDTAAADLAALELGDALL
ncbi:hypothetical protein KBZ15_09465 [Cyanobium sp. BA20m-p-22]|uniref:hypothetical protein n=1 Tax=Cyanobium sp. BA20m-p-22 TaxID=2823704 RepID=UPI0020CC1D61|nr:hypothetical protein [Cyanobium sp. BA20m-p-22]MCP9910132.1 hypothetical protein [Cyanobium sp. BA20m-p-22]